MTRLCPYRLTWKHINWDFIDLKNTVYFLFLRTFIWIQYQISKRGIKITGSHFWFSDNWIQFLMNHHESERPCKLYQYHRLIARAQHPIAHQHMDRFYQMSEWYKFPNRLPKLCILERLRLRYVNKLVSYTNLAKICLIWCIGLIFILILSPSGT